jgi:hypothetical protein
MVVIHPPAGDVRGRGSAVGDFKPIVAEHAVATRPWRHFRDKDSIRKSRSR